MCGVVAAVGADVTAGIAASRHRGPDAEGRVVSVGVALGHARLAIQDVDPRSDQPMTRGRTAISYAGELWSWRTVRHDLEQLGRCFTTDGDTEVVATALDEWGDDALARLDGMFALAWTRGDGLLHLARDRFGELPLSYAAQSPPLAATERKALLAMGARPDAIRDVGPGERVTLSDSGVARRRWYAPAATPRRIDRPEAAALIGAALTASCRKRTISDVPVCALLSGGLDSCLIASLLANDLPGLVCYAAVMDPRSPDLRAARSFASWRGLRLVEVPIPEPTAADLSEVVRVIEQPFKAQVEIGWPCLVLARRIAADGFRVTFSGEGSDELWASYGFSYHALAAGADWHRYRRDLFLGQARKNFPRANKAFMAYGVECRLPFLDPTLVELALSLPEATVRDRHAPKAVLADAARDLVPPEVVARPKLAFQDGLGLKGCVARALPSPERYYRAEYAHLRYGAA